MSLTRQSLLSKAMRAFKWNALGIVARIFLQFGVMVVMARLIAPADFGFFGASLLVYGLAVLVADQGLGMALVQRKELDSDTRRIAWAWLIVSHLLIAGLIHAGAPLLAQWLGDPSLESGVRFMAVPLLITALMVLPMVELRRRIDFRQIQIAQVAGYFTGYVLVALPLAYYGWGGWSLVMALLVQQLVMAALCIHAAPQPLWPKWGRLPSGLPVFGMRVVGSNLANWLTENLDNLLVARFKGVADLGVYSVSYNLARTPVNHVVNLIQQVVFSTSSRVQDDPDALRRGYLALVKAIALVTLPVFIGAAVVSDVVIAALYGPKWAAAAPVFAALCVAMPFHALMAVAGPVLWGAGRTTVELKVQTGVAAALLLTLWLLRHESLSVLAWGVCAVYMLRAVWMTLALRRALALPYLSLLRALHSPAWLALLAALAMAGAQHVLAHTDLRSVLSLLLVMAAGACSLLGVFLLWPRRVLGHELGFLAERLPILQRIAAFRVQGGK